MSALRPAALKTIALSTYVEQTNLPRILVKAKGGLIRYAAHVDGYIRGPKCRVKGIDVVPLYYLSLVDMNGDGGKLHGIWSALISEPPADVFLEPVGTVVLAHHDPQFQRMGYRLHWNYDQTSTGDRDNDLHGVIESNMLTIFDPIQGAAPIRRERKQQKKALNTKSNRRTSRTPSRVTQSTATKKELGDLEERTNREKHPMFLLLVPGHVPPPRVPEEPDEVYRVRRDEAVRAFLAELHFAFLDLRVPWAMSIEWADFLWQRALASSENVQLTTWFPSVVQGKGDDEEQADEEKKADESQKQKRSIPVFCEAWLCRPNIVRLDADLKAARRDGRISDLREPEERCTQEEAVLLPA